MAMLNNQRVFPIVLVHPNHGFFKMFGDPQITTAQGRRLRQWPGRPKTCFDWCPGVKTLEVTWTAQPLQNSYISPIIPYISGDIPHIYIYTYIYIFIYFDVTGGIPLLLYLGCTPIHIVATPIVPPFQMGTLQKLPNITIYTHTYLLYINKVDKSKEQSKTVEPCKEQGYKI